MASRPPEEPPENDDLARNRWMVITILRFGGFSLAVLGLLMSQGAVDIAGEANRLVGYVFLAVGLVDGFVVPQLLARKWRTPRA
jgi:hypothetical protein